MRNIIGSKSKRFYLKDQKGIYKRYIREADNWHNHLVNTKKHILEQVGRHKAKKIAFLGSGWLLDVPVEELIEKDIELHFYDIVHPRQVMHRFRSEPRVKFLYKDLSGLVNITDTSTDFSLINKYLESNPVVLNSNYDLVVSLNIMNQLDGLLLDFFKQSRVLAMIPEKKTRTIIQNSHINLLKKQPALLITDYQELFTDVHQNIIKYKDLIHVDLSAYGCVGSWDWVFDTKGLYRSKFNTIFKVKAINL